MLQILDLHAGLFRTFSKKKLQHGFPKMRGGQRPFGTFPKIRHFGIVTRPLLRMKTQRLDSRCVHLKNGFKGIVPGMLAIAFTSATQIGCLQRLLSCEQILESQFVSEPQQFDFEEAWGILKDEDISCIFLKVRFQHIIWSVTRLKKSSTQKFVCTEVNW